MIAMTMIHGTQALFGSIGVVVLFVVVLSAGPSEPLLQHNHIDNTTIDMQSIIDLKPL